MTDPELLEMIAALQAVQRRYAADQSRLSALLKEHAKLISNQIGFSHLCDQHQATISESQRLNLETLKALQGRMNANREGDEWKNA